MKLVVLNTPAEKARGLIGMSPIPEDTLFVFPGMRPGVRFHSQGVLEPFEIHFFDRRLQRTGWSYIIKPPGGEMITPLGTEVVVEAKVGTLARIGRDGIRAALL